MIQIYKLPFNSNDNELLSTMANSVMREVDKEYPAAISWESLQVFHDEEEKKATITIDVDGQQQLEISNLYKKLWNEMAVEKGVFVEEEVVVEKPAETVKISKKTHKSRMMQIIILGIVLVVIIFGAILVQNKPELFERKDNTEPTPTVSDDVKLPVLDYNSSEIVKMEVNNENFDDTFILTYDENADAWNSNYKQEIRISDSSIASLKYLFTNLLYESILENVTDYSIYGLENPKSSATVTNVSGETSTVLLGDEAPNGYFYIKLEDQPEVYTVYRTTAERLMYDFDFFRYIGLTGIDTAYLNYMQYYEDGELQYTYREIDKVVDAVKQPGFALSGFVIDDYLSIPISVIIENFEEIAVDLQGQTIISEFVDDVENLADLGLENPKYRVIMKDSDGASLDYLFGNYTDDTKEFIYFMVNQTEDVYIVDSSFLKFFENDIIDTLYRAIHLIRITTVEEVNIEGFGIDTELRIKTDIVPPKTINDEAETVYSYFVDDELTIEDDFKDIYAEILNLQYDGIIAEDQTSMVGDEVLSISFDINREGVENSYTYSYAEFNDLYYAVDLADGNYQLLISKSKIDAFVENVSGMID